MVHFSSGDGQATLPASATLSNGTGSFSATLGTAGGQTLTATDSGISGSSAIAVSAAAATHFTVSAPVGATAGTPFSVPVTALDRFNNAATGYSGTIHLSSTDAHAALPMGVGLTNGLGTFAVTLKTAGAQTLTATDTSQGFSSTSAPVAVIHAAATSFSLSDPATTAGTALVMTVSALDAFGNVDTSYSGTVPVTSSDPAAVLPGTVALSNGVAAFSATLVTAGMQTIVVADTSGVVAAVSGQVTVTPGAAIGFTVSTSGAVVADTLASITVTAVDAFGNVATGYSGIVTLNSSDPTATLPRQILVNDGVGTAFAALKSGGRQTISAADSANPALAGTSAPIAVILVATSAPVPTPTSRVLAIGLVGKRKTSATVLEFRVTFSASVSGVNAKAFHLTTHGALHGAHITKIKRVTGRQYLIAISAGHGTGTVRLDVLAKNAIRDVAGNPLAEHAYTRGPSYIKLA
jgi:hypothetical protein